MIAYDLIHQQMDFVLFKIDLIKGNNTSAFHNRQTTRFSLADPPA